MPCMYAGLAVKSTPQLFVQMLGVFPKLRVLMHVNMCVCGVCVLSHRKLTIVNPS